MFMAGTKEKSKLEEKYLGKDDNTKFNEEELAKLKELQSNFWKIHSTFGQLSLARIRLNQQIDDIDKMDDKLKGLPLQTTHVQGARGHRQQEKEKPIKKEIINRNENDRKQ